MQERSLFHGARFESLCHIDYPQDVRCFPQSPKANVGTIYQMRQNWLPSTLLSTHFSLTIFQLYAT
jgi:hypothetical protein